MRILITGGTGSLGQALVKKFIGRSEVERIVVYSRDEVKQGDLAYDYGFPNDPKPLRFFLGDVRDAGRLAHAMQGIDTVIHAAALKRVDQLAYHPFEVLRTNVQGTENVLNAALSAGVKKMLFISTDKACQPENVYGASKLMAEHLVVAFNAMSMPRGLACSVVRYGNVFNSRGSVIEVWRRALANAAPSLKITDLDMTRFVITKPQAVELVLDTLESMHGGEIIVPRLPAMRLAALARAMAGQDCVLEEIGFRPGGEKLHERLLSDEEPRRTLAMSNGNYLVMPSHRTWIATNPYHGVPVPAFLQYVSNSPSRHLTEEELQKMLKEDASLCL